MPLTAFLAFQDLHTECTPFQGKLKKKKNVSDVIQYGKIPVSNEIMKGENMPTLLGLALTEYGKLDTLF